LPSARQKALGKDVFAGIFSTECPLPSVTLGKVFAECIRSFAECPGHSAKILNPVVAGGFNGSGTSAECYTAAPLRLIDDEGGEMFM
jgi:hypothetical protein